MHHRGIRAAYFILQATATLAWWVGIGIAPAWSERTGRSWRTPLQQWLAGGIASSLVHAASVAFLAGSGWSGVLLMLPAVLVTGWLAWTSNR